MSTSLRSLDKEPLLLAEPPSINEGGEETTEPHTVGFATRMYDNIEEQQRHVKYITDMADDGVFWCTKTIVNFIIKLPGRLLDPCRVINCLAFIALLGVFGWNYYTVFFQHELYVLNGKMSVYGEADILVNDACQLPSLLNSQSFCSYYGTTSCPLVPILPRINSSAPSSPPTISPTANSTHRALLNVRFQNSSNVTNSTQGPSASPTSAPTRAPISRVGKYLSRIHPTAFLKIKIQTGVAIFVWLRLRYMMHALVRKKLSAQYAMFVILQNAVSWCFRHWGYVEKSPCSVIFSVYYDRTFQQFLLTFPIAVAVWVVIIWVSMEKKNKGKPNERLIVREIFGGKYYPPDKNHPNGSENCLSRVCISSTYLFLAYGVVVPAAWLGVNNVILKLTAKKKKKFVVPTTFLDFLVLSLETMLVIPVSGLNQFTLAAAIQNFIMVMDVCIFLLTVVYERCTPEGKRRRGLVNK